VLQVCFFFSSRRRHTRFSRDWSSDVCSSDLAPSKQHQQVRGVRVLGPLSELESIARSTGATQLIVCIGDADVAMMRRVDEAADRSEEHTSELQSRENLVCRLLLEKKKTNDRI